MSAGAWVLKWLLSWYEEWPNHSGQQRATTARQSVSHCCLLAALPNSIWSLAAGAPGQHSWSSTVSTLQDLAASVSCTSKDQKEPCSSCEMDWEHSTPMSMVFIPQTWIPYSSEECGCCTSLLAGQCVSEGRSREKSYSNATSALPGHVLWEKLSVKTSSRTGTGWHWGSLVPVGNQFAKACHCCLFCANFWVKWPHLSGSAFSGPLSLAQPKNLTNEPGQLTASVGRRTLSPTYPLSRQCLFYSCRCTWVYTTAELNPAIA